MLWRRTALGAVLLSSRVAGLAIDRMPLRASVGRGLRGGATGPQAAVAGAQEAAIAVPLTSASLAASDAAASEWTGDMMVVPVWEAKEGESIALGAEAEALDKSLSGAVADLIADNEFKG